MSKKKSPNTKSYLPPVSPVAIQPGDTGFKTIGRAYNKWMGLFGEWEKGKKKIANPDTTWDMNKKPTSKSKIKRKSKSLYLQEDGIPGGLADGMNLEDLAKKHSYPLGLLKKELKKGIEVELEHTKDNEIAKEIALDHLFEDPDYYKKLSRVEDHAHEIEEDEASKIRPYLDVDAKKVKKGGGNLENLKDYRDWVNEGKKYKPKSEYKEETRKDLNLDMVRKTKEYKKLIDLGFKETTSHQQEINIP